MTHLTSLTIHPEDLYTEYISSQTKGKQQKQPPDSCIARNFSLPTELTGAETTSYNDSKDKPPSSTEGNKDKKDGKPKLRVTSKTSSDPPTPLKVRIEIPNSIKPNQSQTDNSGIISTIKLQRDLETPKATHSNPPIYHIPISNSQITSYQQKTNSKTESPKSSSPPPLLRNLKSIEKATDENSATSELFIDLLPPGASSKKPLTLDDQ